MPGITESERIAILESIVFSGLSGNQLTPVNSIVNNDFIVFYSSAEGKMVRISGVNFVDQLASGNITFVEDGDVTQVRQDDIIKLLASKVSKTGQYADLLGKPNILTNDDLSNYTLRGGYAGTSQDLKNEIDGLEFNDFIGEFNVGDNTPDLQDSTGIKNQEYKVVNAGIGVNKNFGGGNVVLLRNNDIIIFDGTNWILKVTNNQVQQALSTIPQASTLPVSSNTLYDRMNKIFNTSGYRLTNIQVEGVTNINNIGTPSICFLADNTDRYLLIDFSTLNDPLIENLLREDDRIISVTTTDLSDLPNDDVVGGITNQALFSSTEIESISGVTVPANYTIYEVTQAFSISFSSGQLMNVAIDLVIDQSKTFSKTFSFEDQDFTTANDIELMPAPGANKIYQVKNVAYSQNLTQNYTSTGIVSIVQGSVVVSESLELDSGGVYYKEFPFTAFEGDDGSVIDDIINKPLLLRVNQDILNGLGTVQFYMDIKIISI